MKIKIKVNTYFGDLIQHPEMATLGFEIPLWDL